MKPQSRGNPRSIGVGEDLSFRDITVAKHGFSKTQEHGPGVGGSCSCGNSYTASRVSGSASRPSNCSRRNANHRDVFSQLFNKKGEDAVRILPL